MYSSYTSSGVRKSQNKRKGTYGWVDLEDRIGMYQWQPQRRRRLTRSNTGGSATPPRLRGRNQPGPDTPVDYRITPWEATGAGGMLLTPFLTPGQRRRRADPGGAEPKTAAAKKDAAKKKPTFKGTQWGGASGSGSGNAPPKPPPGAGQPLGGQGGRTQRGNYQPVYPRGTTQRNNAPVRNTGRPQNIGKGGRSNKLVPMGPHQVAMGPQQEKSHWDHIQDFASRHGVEATTAAFGVLGLAALGMPLFGAAGAAAGAAGGAIELGELAVPLLGGAARAGLGRAAGQGIIRAGGINAYRALAYGVEQAVPAVARAIGWGPIRRAAGWGAAARWGGPFV